MRRILLATFPPVLLALGALTPGLAYAGEGSQYGTIGQYGEVTRFGGFDTTWFDEGKYDGKGGTPNESEPKPGEFVDPVGFAVDIDDEGTGATAVYVLDRVSGVASVSGSNGTEWRLQKLSDTGAVLGVSEFYLQKDEVTGAGYGVFAGVVGLTVDDNTGTVDTVLYDSTGSGENTTRQVDEILDWSTKPDGSDHLVAPSGATLDAISTPVSGYSAPGVLSGASKLGVTPLYEPQGLALDGTGDLAIEADGATRNGGAVEGPAVVEQVSIATGTESGNWSASSLTDVTNSSSEDETALAAGISNDPGGSLNVLLSTQEGNSYGVLDDVKLSSALTDPTVLTSKNIEPAGEIGTTQYPAAPKPDSPAPTQVKLANGRLGSGGGQASSAQVVQLANGLFASDFWDNGASVGYWTGSSNEGIRLIEPEADELLTNPLPPATSVFDTLGDSTAGGNCYIGEGGVKLGTNTVTLAAGANGAIWVLTAGKESSSYSSGSDAAYLTGRQIIEFAPGGSKTCAGPSGTFTVAEEGGTPQPASSPLTVPVGSTLDFNASPIEYPANNGGKPAGIYAFEWAPTLGATTNGGYTTINDELEVSGGTLLSPSPTASYTYDSPGVYTVGLKLLGDFGEYQETGTVTVQTAGLPTASFNTPSEAQTGQNVNLDASASQPASGASIIAYAWKFGDGATDDTSTPTDTHTYTTPGTYTITLTVRDNDNQQSTATTKQITITNPPSNNNNNNDNNSTNNNNNNSGSSTSGSTTTTQPGVSVTPPATTSNTPKPLTTAQKLAAALKTCKKDKSKSRRASCEKAAKKKYTAKAPAKKKKSAKKGKK